ncbi:MAG: alanine--tRNA ligase [Clostridia bacterium]|nr:alanine--tRNA ligase [Clostridia bacterium]
MKWTSLNDLRESYLSFFESKGHLRHKSFPLIPPADDKSLLLINAGMAPLKKYFKGEEEPPRHRMTTCQKCIRTPDIERVGKTARHGTFFEMLGNFSFGDYFKKEATAWAWEYLTKVIEIPEDRLWVTIYEDDDEAFEIWNKQNGVPADRIIRLGKEDNFWEIGSGPCGPCSEIHFDRGPGFGCGRPDCAGVTCDCDRVIEIWNLVFTQFDGDGNGNYTPLAKPNIDTGMGLERLAVVMQGVNNLFEVDTVQNIMKAISEKAGIKYGADEKSDIALRVITDHIRSTCFLVCDGVVPSNEGRGYVLRRLLRRAARYGKLLGIKGTFLSDIVPVVAHENLTAYPELTEKLEYIKKIVSIEEEKFSKTIDGGMEILNSIIEKTIAAGADTLPGEDVFRLNDTFGFPLDLTREIAEEKGLKIDEEGFVALMNEQKQRARKARADKGDFGWATETLDLGDVTAKTEFVGYTENKCEATVLALIDADVNEVTGTKNGGKVIVVLDKTPFYGEGGGQVGDTGCICADGLKIEIKDTKKTNDGIYLHVGEVLEGSVSVGDTVVAVIDTERRAAIRRNHSAAHLLQAALRQVLGTHVEQAGSYVDEHRVRFDFSHYTAMSREEIAKVEQIVNGQILSALPVETVETDIETAKKSGAMALFGEKYGAVVRMVKMGDFSTELCGGTHLKNTAEAGLFKIISESSVASGVRRIEGTTGKGVLELIAEQTELIENTAKELKTQNPHDIDKRAAQLSAELKAEKAEREKLNDKLAAAAVGSLLDNRQRTGRFTLISGQTNGMTVNAVRGVLDKIKSEPDTIAVISTCADGRYNLIVTASDGAVKLGANSGAIIKALCEITGGGGGGRPDSATAGIKDGGKLPLAFEKLPEIIGNI